jgi:surface antigen/peptidoglycan hydrolase CwlO-like protein
MIALNIVTKNIFVLIPKSVPKRIALGVCAAIVAIAGPLQLTNSLVHAVDYNGQINALQDQINQYQSRAGDLHKQADSLQAAVAALTEEKNAIQAQLDLSQAKYDQLTADIAANKIKLAENQDALGKIVADLYVDKGITPLEMLASSKNVGDYMDKNEYRSSVSSKLDSTITAVKTLKTQLETDQKAVTKVLEDQKLQRESLAAKEAEQQQLLDQTKGEEAAYQSQIANTRAQMAQIAAEQRAALARLTGGGNYGSVGSFQFRNYSGNSGCGGGGYTLCGEQDSYTDQWGLYNEECVSYTAWAAATQYGKYVTNFSGAGNANQWPSTASNLMGATVDHTPEVGAVAILPSTPGFAPIGHAMMVEAILGGGWVAVSQYNFGGTGQYSTMEIASSGVVFVHFRDR